MKGKHAATDPAVEDAPSSDGKTPSSAEGASPFGPKTLSVDRGIKIAIVSVLAAIVLVGGFLGWLVYNNQHLAVTQSPAARAVANLAAIVAATPNAAGARVKLAEAMVANDQLDEAIAQLQAALTIEKDNANALTDLGLIAMQRGQWPLAETYWIKLVGILGGADMASKNTALADVYYYLGSTYVEEKRYEDAVANLKRSLSIKRDSSPAHYILSVAYSRLELPDMQKQELEIVIAFDPKHAQANYDLGVLALADGDVAQAAEYFRVAADNAPAGVTDPSDQLAKLGTAADHLASAQSLQTSDPAQALSEARIAAALDPSNAATVKLVAQLAEKLKDTQRALNAWRRYLELVPGDTTATDAIQRLSANAK
jgi:tetratricopeptide (TPR) repeat protein